MQKFSDKSVDSMRWTTAACIGIVHGIDMLAGGKGLIELLIAGRHLVGQPGLSVRS